MEKNEIKRRLNAAITLAHSLKLPPITGIDSRGKRNRGGGYVAKRNALLKIKYNYKCQICGFSVLKQIRKIEKTYTCSENRKRRLLNRLKEKIQAHHIVPLSNGGSLKTNNILIVCDSCHKKIHERGIK